MALKPVGTQFITKGFSTFTKQLEAVNKQYRNLGASINLTGNSISAFGARLSVFSRNGKAYAQWVDAATSSFLKHSEVQERFQNSIDGGNQKIKAINETLAALTASSAKVHPALIAIGATIGVATVAFKVFKSAINGVVSVVEAAVSPFVRLGSAIWDIGKKIADFALGDIFAAFGRTLSQVKDGITNTVSEFQTLTIQYESLIARQLRAKNSNLTVAQSLRVAADQAKGLLDWVKQIAVTTPFEVETISRTLAFAQAMGFTASESKTVTTAIINFTAAMGLGQETMERIIQNFGQMRAAGKVTGTELRDLARGALLPVNDILNRMAENAGVAADQWDDFREAASKGEVPVDAFFEAFVQLANESFPSAAERMSRTFEGVKNNIIDFFKTVVGLEALGPVFDRITGLMADALDKLLSPAVREAAKIVGESLLQGFNMVWDAVQNRLVPALKNLAQALGLTSVDGFTFATVIAKISAVLTVGIDKISAFVNMLAEKLSGQFAGTAQSAGEWGFNIIASLAEGMAAAAQMVVNVLIQLGNIIAEWLQPGSPPKLLPKLDQWGAEAMTEYMKGWTKADFSIFNDISDLVESFIRSLSGTTINETDVVPFILAIRDNLAQAMNEIAKSGKASAQTIKEIFDAIKGGTPELQEYVRLQIKLAEENAKVAKEQEKVAKAEDVVRKKRLELAAANKLVEQAQDKLNAVTARYDAILDPLKRKLDEISDRGDELDDIRRITQLQLILADVNASALDKERARIEIDKLKTKSVIRGIENQKDAAEAAAQEEVDAAQEKADAVEAEVEAAEYALDLAEDRLAAAEALRDAVAEEMAAVEELIQMQIDTNNLIKEQLDLLESLKDKAAGAGSSFADLFEEFGGIGSEDFTRKVSGQLTDFKDKITSVFEEVSANVSEKIDEIIGKFSGLGESLGTLGETWSSAFTSIKEEIEEWRAVLEFAFQIVRTTFDEQSAGIMAALELLGIDFGEHETLVTKVLDALKLAVLAYSIDFSSKIELWGTLLQEALIAWGVWKNGIIPILEELQKRWLLFWVRMIQITIRNITKFFNFGKAIIQGLWDGMLSIWDSFISWVEDNFGYILDILRQVGLIQSPSKVMYSHGKNLMLGLAEGMKDAASIPVGVMKDISASVVSSPVASSSSQTNNITNNNFNLTMPTTASPAGVQRAFNVMRVMVG